MTTEQMLKILVGMFVVLSPVTNIAFFSAFTAGQNLHEKHRTAHVTSLTVGITLITVIWIGKNMLNFFGISIGSFQIGAGIALLLVGVDMLKSAPIDPNVPNTNNKFKNAAVVPLGIPIIVGPATMSFIISETQEFGTLTETFIMTGLAGISTLIVWIFLIFAVPIAQRLGINGINIISRITGLIYLAIAAELAAKGAKNLLAHL
jgi:multiple antibiotic resistance protein